MAARLFSLGLILLLFVGAVGCASPREAFVGERGSTVRTNENLHTVLWTQTAVEYRASALQAYRAARVMLDRALADSGWTAALEQAATGRYGALPPAVVLDVDETVLENAPYQAMLVQTDAEYGAETWDAWVQAAQAAPVPGALGFTRYADSLGVTVLYVTNRRSHLEDATKRNLADQGFPLASAYDPVLTRGEQPAWATGDKGPRREAVATQYRILLLVGDNLGDFISGGDTTAAARDALVSRYTSYWGTRWIVLPNPQYGSWEGALFDFDYGLTRPEKLKRKYEALEIPKQ